MTELTNSQKRFIILEHQRVTGEIESAIFDFEQHGEIDLAKWEGFITAPNAELAIEDAIQKSALLPKDVARLIDALLVDLFSEIRQHDEKIKALEAQLQDAKAKTADEIEAVKAKDWSEFVGNS